MTVLEFQADATVQAAAWLARCIDATAEDRLNWQPSADEKSNTRSVLEVAAECVGINRITAGLLRGEPFPEHRGGPMWPPITSAAEAKQGLVESAQELAVAMRAADESILQKIFSLPFGDMPGIAIILFPAGNMMYHNGQVNFIQRLYGDLENYSPPTN